MLGNHSFAALLHSPVRGVLMVETYASTAWVIASMPCTQLERKYWGMVRAVFGLLRQGSCEGSGAVMVAAHSARHASPWQL